MSALFSHAVRWEFCSHNPISSGIPVGSGGKRGPSTGVRVSAKRQKSPLKLTAEQVALVLTELEFRDQLLVFLDAGLGTRRGELGALRWMDCDFINQVFDIQHSYYWRRGGHLIDTKSEASAQPLPMHPALKDGLLEWRIQSLYNQPGDYVFASERLKGRKPLDLASVLKKKIQPAFKRIGITGVGWHTFRHTVGTMLAEMGRTPTHHPGLPAAQQSACHQQVPAGDVEGQAPGAGQVGRCHPAHGLVARAKADPMKVGGEQTRGGKIAFCCLSSPNIP